MVTARGVVDSGLPDRPVSGGGRREKLARLCHRSGALPLLRQVRAVLRGDLRILAYHRVLESSQPAGFEFDIELISASADAFRDQMRSIRRNFTPLRFDEVLDHVEAGRPLPKNAVLVTFDDGYEDNYRVAFPILKELGMSAMFFVSTGHIGSGAPYAYDWLVHMLSITQESMLPMPELQMQWRLPQDLAGRRESAACLLDRVKVLDAVTQEALITRLEHTLGMPRRTGISDCMPMDWSQLREMRSGGMEIGSHGVDHRMLGKLPVAEMRREVHESKAVLERELGHPIDVLSYPVGSGDAFNDAVVREVRAAGYRMACSYITGVGRVTEATRFTMPRLPVEVMDSAWFEAMVTVPEIFSYPLRRRAGS